MHTSKTSSNSETPQKGTPHALQQPKTIATDSTSAYSPIQSNRNPKERSPKVAERRSPRSPASERKHSSRVSELESQVSQLQEDLKKTKDKLTSAKSWKKQAQQEDEDAQKHINALCLKLEASQQQIIAHSCSNETNEDNQHTELSRNQKLTWESDLASAREEIENLKLEIEMVIRSEAEQKNYAESTNIQLQNLKGNLTETLTLVENMKVELQDCKEKEARAKGIVNETLQQLEVAKATVESLRSEHMKASEAYNSVVSELEQSKTRVKQLEGLVSKLKDHFSLNLKEQKMQVHHDCGEANELEKVQSLEDLKSACELMERMKPNSSCQKEAELVMKLKRAEARIEELGVNLIDKETDLQGIVEENERLKLKLENNLSFERESKLEQELKRLMKELSDLKACSVNKEMELHSVLEENQCLKLEIEKRNENANKSNGQLDAAREAEREAMLKVSILMEEVEKSKSRANRVAEQLEAVQASGAEMEGELRRLKVQSDQWRKAAEAAVAMLSLGTNKEFMDRKGSYDRCYNPGKMGSPYGDDGDDDLMKKKNGNVLKKFGGLWKKPQK
ncbi:hypothetical protein SAY87_005500 [Trapa incisa]|uniref:Interactor of constitutive active ROPs 3 n=1 Tax=Trapa incisa TaxID=236973 RepID=A0AAN7Q707_9MYRT|nr:hypothetical protein SAY87_005500 [Trapa incisa]